MFRDIYKSANDDIEPDSGLLDKILASEPKKAPAFNTYYKYGSVAAAFFILIGTFSIYPKISSNLNSAKDEALTGIEKFETVTEQLSDTTAAITPAPEQSEIPAIASTAPVENSNKQDKENSKVISKKQVMPASKHNINTPTPTTATDLESLSPTYGSDKQKNDETSDIEESITIPQTAKAETDTQNHGIAVASLEEAEISESSEAPVYSMKSSGSSGGASRAKSISSLDNEDLTSISQETAERLADDVFLSDFGAEFLSITERKTEYDEGYLITRYNENVCYTVKVLDDGSTEKQY